MSFSDLRYALRSLLREPGFAVAAVLSLGLGIGVDTAVFSLVRGILLQPLPYRDGDRLLILEQHSPGAGLTDTPFSIPELWDYRERTRSFDDLVEYHSMSFTLLGGEEPLQVLTGVVSAGFFDVLGTEPLLGRAFRPEDEALGAEAVLVLGYGFWQRALGGDPDVVGRFFEMNNKPHRVVGVLPPIPQFPRENDVYMPTSACPFRAAGQLAAAGNRNAFRALRVMGRLRDGVTVAQARDDVARAGRTISAEHPDVTPPGAAHRSDAMPLQERLTRDARPTLTLLSGTALLVLILACANVGNLSLARLLRRERDLAVRASLGATRGHLVRLSLAEALLLAGSGGVLGVVLATWSLDLLVRFASRFTPRAAGVSVDAGVLAFAAAVAAATAVAMATLPILTGGIDAQRAFTETSRGSTDGVRRLRLRGALIAGQVAVSLTLLAGAGLMLRSLQRLQSVDPGFRSDQVLVAAIPPNWTRFTSAADTVPFLEELQRRLAAIPGVATASLGSTVPLSPGGPNPIALQIEGRPVDPGEVGPTVLPRVASPGYFATLQVPLLRGRDFTDSDGQGAPPVVVINRSLAERYWPGADPVGARVSIDGGATWPAIVGVVGDIHQQGLDQEVGEEVYRPAAQAGFALNILVRTAGDPSAVAQDVKSAVYALAPDQPVTGIQRLSVRREEAVATPRLTATLLGLFAGLALLVTALGIGGLLAYDVAQRTREIGIRVALGARQGDVLRLVTGGGMRLVAVGAVLGIGCALVLGRSMAALLFRTSPADPIPLAAAAVVLGAVSLLACLVPARRASRVDPSVALRAV